MLVCPVPGYDYDQLKENGFRDFMRYVAGIQENGHLQNRNGNNHVNYNLITIDTF